MGTLEKLKREIYSTNRVNYDSKLDLEANVTLFLEKEMLVTFYEHTFEEFKGKATMSELEFGKELNIDLRVLSSLDYGTLGNLDESDNNEILNILNHFSKENDKTDYLESYRNLFKSTLKKYANDAIESFSTKYKYNSNFKEMVDFFGKDKFVSLLTRKHLERILKTNYHLKSHKNQENDLNYKIIKDFWLYLDEDIPKFFDENRENLFTLNCAKYKPNILFNILQNEIYNYKELKNHLQDNGLKYDYKEIYDFLLGNVFNIKELKTFYDELFNYLGHKELTLEILDEDNGYIKLSGLLVSKKSIPVDNTWWVFKENVRINKETDTEFYIDIYLNLFEMKNLFNKSVYEYDNNYMVQFIKDYKDNYADYINEITK